MANINTKLSSEHEKLLLAAYNDLIFFGKTFLAGDFKKSSTPWFHYVVADELISPSRKPCAIILPRGHAKTTLIKASIIRDFCFAKKAAEWGFEDEEKALFCGWVSSNQRKSQNNVAYVQMHLEHNAAINFYFGKNGSLKGDRWNQEDIKTVYGDRLLSSSNLTSMRGDTLATIEHGAVRYTRTFIDDAENEDNTRTRLSREKIVDNIMNGIMPAIEKNRDGCHMFLIETPVHFDCFAQQILDKWEKIKKEGQEAIDDYSWKVITYKATQPDRPGGVLWPSYMSRERLDEIKQTYRDSPRGIAGYYQEYELEVQTSETALFGRDHIQYHDGEFIRRDGTNYLVYNNEPLIVNTFLGCDPATDIETKNSDYSVIMVIAVDDRGNIYVLDYERHRSIPTIALKDKDEKIIGRKGVVDYIIDMSLKYGVNAGVVEDVAMNRSIIQSLDNERTRRGLWGKVGIIPEKPGGRDKINRIYTGLSSYFSGRKIFVRETHHDLVNEIIKFGPKMAHDDTIETLYYATRKIFPPKTGRAPFDIKRKVSTARRPPRAWHLL